MERTSFGLRSMYRMTVLSDTPRAAAISTHPGSAACGCGNRARMLQSWPACEQRHEPPRRCCDAIFALWVLRASRPRQAPIELINRSGTPSGSCRLMLLRPHRSLRCGDRIMLLDSRESRKRICKLPGPQTRKPCNLKSTKPPKNDSRSVG
jgi:hypothetical protein